MAGPDSKRMYLSIVAQNMEKIKSDKPYWNKNFVPITATGAGAKYTALQAAMMLKKMKVVKFLVGHPAVDLSVKSSDNRSTLMVAAQSGMPLSVLEKLLDRYDLKTINELDPGGSTALDLCEPNTEEYEFLQSVGCRTKADREAALQGFLVSAGKHVVHQRVKTRNPSGVETGGRTTTSPGKNDCQKTSPQRKTSETDSSCGEGSDIASDAHSERSPSRHEPGDQTGTGEQTDVDEEVEDPWKLFDSPKDLERVLQAYLDAWGEEGDDGELCKEWVKYVSKKIEKGKGKSAVEKWNDLMIASYGKEHVSRYVPKRYRQVGEQGKDEEGEGLDKGSTFSDTASRSRDASRKGAESDPGVDGTQGVDALKNFFDPTAPPIECKTPRKPPPPDGGKRVVGIQVDKEQARKEVAGLFLSSSRSEKSRRGSKK
ncbi:ankyrin repeat-containing protein [Cystoisospora suis]|uniref:Ankyrin repeat-containing protein n=1 Tax=Cystoisospora suis TaxID=483139 RepID=A0A2C6KLZ1_9APIC|nr:ankyrin repeat-containing protein [Cystoisospora suis]